MDGFFLHWIPICFGQYRRVGRDRSSRRHPGTNDARQNGARRGPAAIYVRKLAKQHRFHPGVSRTAAQIDVWRFPFLRVYALPVELSVHRLRADDDEVAQDRRAFFYRAFHQLWFLGAHCIRRGAQNYAGIDRSAFVFQYLFCGHSDSPAFADLCVHASGLARVAGGEKTSMAGQGPSRPQNSPGKSSK